MLGQLKETQKANSTEQFEPTKFEIFSAEAYIDHLCNDAIPNAQEEIHLQSMVWHFETDLEKRVLQAILDKKKANRDLPIRLYFRFGNDLSNDDIEALSKLNKAGVQVVPTERGLFFKDHTGQNHRKLGFIDGVAYWGGVNIHEEVITDTLDCMIRTNNPGIVAQIKYALLHETRPSRDLRGFRTVSLSRREDPGLSIDAGIFDMIFEQGGPDRRSEIIERSVKMIEMATDKVVLVSQFIPDGRVLKALLDAAKRGVVIEVVTNHPQTINGLAYQTSAFANLHKINMFKELHDRHHRSNGNERMNFNVRTLSDRVHLKALFVDGDSCLVGSDNFVRAGEIFQTAEFAVLTDNKEIVNGLKRLVNKFARKAGDPIFFDINYLKVPIQ